MRILPGAALVFALVFGSVFPDNPPPAHTGGFGEPTCLACHFDGELNPEGGALALEGIADGYRPGETYVLEVLLDREGLERGGFQLAARFSDGRQAGRLEGRDAAVAVDTSAGVQYARHTKEGVTVNGPGGAIWRVAWQAPHDTAIVVFDVSANASNNDASPFGDDIYHLSVSRRSAVTDP